MSEKKYVGIMSQQNTNNFGAVIGAAALGITVQKILGDEFEVENILYSPSSNGIKDLLLYHWFAMKQWGGAVPYAKSLAKMLTKGEEDELTKERSRKTDKFRADFMNSTPLITDASKIINGKNYAAAIVSFDSWRPKLAATSRADGFFLKFAKRENKAIKTISYAATTDTKRELIPKKLDKVFKDDISYIDVLGVRDETCLNYISSLTDKPVVKNCDICLAADTEIFEKMADAANVEDVNGDYIYAYILEQSPVIAQYAEKLARETGLKLLYASEGDSGFGSEATNCWGDGPCEFLYRIKNAKYVISNSLHCSIFSILFKKQFVTFSNRGTGSKLTDLLTEFDLKDRLTKDGSDSKLLEPVDFEGAYRVLERERECSLRFLNDALESIK